MTRHPIDQDRFILSAFDREQWCPVLQTMFLVSNVPKLRALLKLDANEDMTRRNYWLQPDEVAAVITAFNVNFDPKLAGSEFDIALFMPNRASEMPYLIHGGFELPLLLDGQKKLARFRDTYPPITFEGEDRFDCWVAQGILHKQVLDEPFDSHIGNAMGVRTVYYTVKGEEWRIPAMELIWRASGKAGGWNDYFERLEGMLFGYEDWHNDWWIEAGQRRGGFGGASMCCTVTAAGLAWLESAAFRALPPCDRQALAVTHYDDSDPAKMRAFLLEEVDSVALVCFAVPLWLARELLPLSPESKGRWLVPSHRLPELNRLLRSAVAVAALHDDLS